MGPGGGGLGLVLLLPPPQALKSASAIDAERMVMGVRRVMMIAFFLSGDSITEIKLTENEQENLIANGVLG